MEEEKKAPGVHLIEESERLKLKLDGSTIFYRRLPAEEQNAIRRDHTTNGKIDQDAAAQDIARKSIVGWDNVLKGGVEVECTEDAKKRLPVGVLLALFARLNAAVIKESEALGN